jgi:hypothetical protein
MSEQSAIHRIKELDKERATLFEQAKEEALRRANLVLTKNVLPVLREVKFYSGMGVRFGWAGLASYWATCAGSTVHAAERRRARLTAPISTGSIRKRQ